MKRFSLTSVVSIILFFIAGLSTATLVWPSPGIEVVPLEHDFGDVELGSSSSTIITVTNDWYDTLLLDIRFQEGSSQDFYITYEPSEILPFQSADVEVTYTPSSLGYAQATLIVDWTNGVSGAEYVSLGGEGVETEPPLPLTIEAILEFFDSSVEEGMLWGNGPVNSAEKRLSVLMPAVLCGGVGATNGLLIGGVTGALLGTDKTLQIEGMTDSEIKETLDKLRKKARIRDYK